MSKGHRIVIGIDFIAFEIKIVMNLNKLTLKTQEALQAAQQNAFENKHPQVEKAFIFRNTRR